MGGLSRNDRPTQRTIEPLNRNPPRQRRNIVLPRTGPFRPKTLESRPSIVVAARLGPALLTRFRIVAGSEYRLIEAASWSVLRDVVRASPTQVAVVDPCIDGFDDAAMARAIDAIRAIEHTVTVFVYTPLTPGAMRTMLTLSANGLKHFVISGVDDDIGRFRERLEEFRAPGMEEEVLAPVLTALSGVSLPAISGALRTLFRMPRRFQTAEDVAAWAGVTRQYFNRRLADAGLVPLRLMVVAARVLRAYQHAQVPGLTLSDVATRLRYADLRTLTRHVRELTGTTLSAWTAAVTPMECVAQVRARLGIGAGRALVLLSSGEGSHRELGTGA